MSPNNPLLAAPSRRLPGHVVVVGAGTIGPDIGYYLKSAIPTCAITFIDVSQPALDKAMSRFETYTKDALKRGRIDSHRANEIMSSVSCSVSYDGIGDADWVIEAATESLPIKHQIFKSVEAAVSPAALITSNTSSLPARRVFEVLNRKERATVTHFFSPAARNIVVEVVKADHLDEQALSDLRWILCATGKVPIITTDVTCFMLDRIFDNWCNEAALLLDCASADEIDAIAREFVHAGPFQVLNLANGNPIIIEANTAQADEEGEHYRPASILRSVKSWNVSTSGSAAALSSAEAARIRDRLMGILFSQSVDILDRRVGQPADLELGCRLALGFRNGPLTLMQNSGQAEFKRIADRLSHERPGMPSPLRPYREYHAFQQHILLDSIDDVVVITMRRPEAGNAVTEDVLVEIVDALKRFQEQENIRGFVITGYGTSAFADGYDLHRLSEVLGDKEAALTYAGRLSQLFLEIERCPKPVVAAVNGLASGAGLELAFRCHARVAAQSASFHARDVELGLVPPFGMLATTLRRWPDAAPLLQDAFCLSVPIRAEQARDCKMVSLLAVDYADLIRQAVGLIQDGFDRQPADISGAGRELNLPTRINQVPSGLSRCTAGRIDATLRAVISADSYEAALCMIHDAFAEGVLARSADEGVRAARERRKPSF